MPSVDVATRPRAKSGGAGTPPVRNQAKQRATKYIKGLGALPVYHLGMLPRNRITSPAYRRTSEQLIPTHPEVIASRSTRIANHRIA